MNRRFLVSLLKRCVFFAVAVCLACTAQSNPAELNQRIERQVRARFQLPATVDLKIGPRQKSDFPNYDKIVITFSQGERKQDFEFLLSKDGKEMLRMSKFDLTKDPYADVIEKLTTTGRPYRGNKDAKVTIVNFDDFQCPFCSRMHQTLTNDIMKAYGDKVKLVYKDFPLFEIHPWANRAAVDANCLGAQSNDAYWAFADYIHTTGGHEVSGERGKPLPEQFAAVDKIATEQGKKFNLDDAKLQACLKAQNDDAVKASVQEANELGVQATPTLFINGEKIDGAVPAEQLRAVLDRALKGAGQQTPATASLPSAPGR